MTDSLVTSGRTFADRYLGRDRCDAYRKTGVMFDAATGENQTIWSPLYSDLSCHIRPMSDADRTIGGDPVNVVRFKVILPWTVDGMLPDDILVVVTSADADLEGRSLIVESVEAATFLTRRVVQCRLGTVASEESS